MTIFELPKAAYGFFQARKASKALNDLAKQPEPEYRSAVDIYNEADANTKSGYSPEEKAAFMGNLNRARTASQRIASDRNPNLAGVINAGINYGNIGALNQFASDDASLRRQKISQLASGITAQSNANTSNAINLKRQKEAAYGEAYKAGVGNVMNIFDAMNRDAATLTSIVAGGGLTGGGTGVPTQLGATQVPARGAQNPATPPSYYGTDQWATNLYGNPAGRSFNQQPIMTNPEYQFSIPYNIPVGPRATY